MNNDFKKNRNSNGLQDTGQASTFHKDQLRNQLQQNFTARKKKTRFRTLTMMSVVCVFLISSWQFTDVGSDGFTLLVQSNEELGINTFQSPFSKKGFGLSSSGTQTKEEQHQEMELLLEAAAGGNKRVLGYTGWTVANETHFSVDYEVWYEDLYKVFQVGIQDGSKMKMNLYGQFMIHHGDNFIDLVRAGEIPVFTEATVEIEGSDLHFKRWKKKVEGFGDVIYWIADYTPKPAWR